MRSLRYRDKGSPVHRLNPVCKLAWAGSVFAAALILDHPLFLFLLLLSTLPVVFMGKVREEWTSFMKLGVYLAVSIIVINALVSYHGDHVLAEAPFRIPVMGTPVITVESILFGVAASMKLLTIISAFAIVSLTVSPDDVMLAMIKLKLPYRSVLVTALSTRFAPSLIDDYQRISDVQRTRGVEFNAGGLYRRARNRASLFIPLVSNSLDRTVQIAEAMESRGFGRPTRTFHKGLTLDGFDFFALVMALVPGIAAIAFFVAGIGEYDYYPALSSPGLNAIGWSALFLLALSVASMALIGVLKRRPRR